MMSTSIGKRSRACLFASVAGLAAAVSAQAAIDVSPVPVTNKTSALPKGWNKNAAFMEIFVRSYQDSDGDGIGDFKGLTSRLDYLQKMGVTGIWLMPIGPSQDHDHGYAQNDYRAIDPQYGTMADFDEFLAEAHKRGIGVIIDYVINHSGSGNAIFLDAAKSKSSAYRDWYIFADSNPGWYDEKMRGVSGAYWTDPWKPVKDGEGLYYGVFDTSMPDWNLRNPKVMAYLKDSMRFWLNKGVDGFRLDAVTMLLEDGKASYFNNSGNAALVVELRKAMDEYDNRYLICEASEGRELYLEACSAFAYGVQQHLIDGIKKGMVAKEVVALMQDPKFDLAPLALQSHDSYVGDRLTNQFGVNGGANYRVAAAIAILVSATPFAYYGEEIGMSNGGIHNDPGLRSPMSWTGDTKTAGFTTGKPYRDVAINVAGVNVAAQESDPDSLLAYYTSLYKVRQAHPVIATGAFKLLSKAGDPYLAFSRTDKAQQAVIIANVSAEPQTVTVDAKSTYQYALGGQGAMTPANGKLSVTVAPKATVVLTAGSAPRK